MTMNLDSYYLLPHGILPFAAKTGQLYYLLPQGILPFAAWYITFCRKMVLYRADLQIVTQIFAS